MNMLGPWGGDLPTLKIPFPTAMPEKYRAPLPILLELCVRLLDHVIQAAWPQTRDTPPPKNLPFFTIVGREQVNALVSRFTCL